MMNFLVVVLCVFAVSGALSKPWDEMQMDERWVDWKMTFEKAYETKLVEQQRYLIWQQNLKNVILHNMHSEASYQLGLNEFSDLGFEEFKQTKLGCYKIPENMIVNGTVKSFAERTFEMPAGQVPDTVDWRSQGYVTPVKNQGQCGSCWAFSTTGSLEGQTFRKTGTLPSLSEQNLIDCAGKYGDQGCNGGWMDYAFTYVKANHGIDSEVGYPYYARALGYCYYRPQYNLAKCTGFVDIPTGDEAALKAAVASIGPISVAIDATHASFSAYRTGVYYEPACGNAVTSLDHAVLVVGYGTEKGQDYWLVKNSWGNAWGDQGYIKMSRNRNNQCGIATKASYPLV